MSVKISVVIPIYCVEQYLLECVNSVQRQSYKNMEIILVDDGSTDKSTEMCDLLAERDSRIKAIHKTNGGLSDARNTGIQYATGDYLLFLDGDDFWDDETAIARLVDRINITKADVLNFSYKKYYEDTGEKVPYFNEPKEMPIDLKEKSLQLDYLTRHGLYIASACNKLICKELLDEKMQFKKDTFSEDIEWCARLIIYAKSMDFLCENFYCYRQRKTSITHTISKKKCDDLCQNILTCISIADKAKEHDKIFIKRYTAYQYGTFFKVQAQSEEEASDSIVLLSKNKWILKYHSGNKKLIVLWISCRFFGYKNTCRFIRYIYDKRR